ncbi:hypothetical protein K9N68_10815 [Kovacikia minuta CCNUW1]|uniref:hypothetical protein n=1 Tax=Kovacikia minuta TaxID=2931930 RepID=UPI001CCEB7EE|nr:hypothetical protein [Kovacikia minuta]UBF28320.1 hypothetical protein K9N68_10815 [Kovacikia minuta CCNUW1]
MNSSIIDYAEKMFSLSLGAIGTWLALRTFYEKRHQETLDRYASSQQKAYAAERDFEHLRRNQEQMKEALKMFDEELSETREDVREIKGMMVATIGKMGESISGILHRREG